MNKMEPGKTISSKSRIEISSIADSVDMTSCDSVVCIIVYTVIIVWFP